jgi:dihydroorotate dehydrogenase
LYSRVIRPALFALDAERAHDLTMAALRQPLVISSLGRAFQTRFDRHLSQTVCGLDFANPLGLAAGLDKQGTAIAAWSALGFGCAEIGTVTPKPQPGNPKPRLFRLPQDRAIINRFGFNSEGAAGVARNLARNPPDVRLKADTTEAIRLKPDSTAVLRVGINIGKNKDTPNDRAAEDYVASIDLLHPCADYFAINVSSPNTAGLRDLQESQSLRTLVEQAVCRVREKSPDRAIPILVKLSPDTAEDDLLRSADAAIEGGAAGLIATNTTVGRPDLRSGATAREAGGLSGAPLKVAATSACRLLFRHFGKRVPIVGVGGIVTASDAYERIRSGATLIQVYTALIYEGPGLVQMILTGLTERLTRDGFSRIEEAVGVEVE